MRIARVKDGTVTEYKPKSFIVQLVCRHIKSNDTTVEFKCRVCQSRICLNCECACYAGKREVAA